MKIPMKQIPCDICGSLDHSILFTKERDGHQFRSVVCRDCGLVFQSPRYSIQDIEAYYSNGRFSIDAREGRSPSRKKITESEMSGLQRYKILKRNLVPSWLKGKQCLEIGCGIGSFLWLIRGAGAIGYGIEPDKVYSKFGSYFYNQPLSTDIYQNSKVRNQKYDLIALFHVIEHVESPKKMLEQVHKNLNNDGRVFIEVPCIERPCGGNLGFFFWRPHLFYFSLKTLSQLLNRVGYHIESSGFHQDFLWIIGKKGQEKSLCQRHKEGAYTVKRYLYIQYARKHIRDLLNRLKEIKKKGFKVCLKLLKLGQTIAGKYKDRKKTIHIGMHRPGNAGDTLLYVAVRKATQAVESDNWELVPLWNKVGTKEIGKWNNHYRGIILGGGGVFLKDTNPNNISGWQWPCPYSLLPQLKVPLVFFAVGYNKFRAQEKFEKIFHDNINKMVEKAVFFGVRNTGSIRALGKIVNPNLTGKIVYQPCPTTILKYLYPDIHSAQKLKTEHLALNIAFDRHDLRFSNKSNHILRQIAQVMKWVNQKGWKIDLTVHVPTDELITPWLDEALVDYTIVNLHAITADKVMMYYRDIPLTIGMRGHSQMIPFGFGNAIISLVSHNKMRWFLEDIGAENWGVEVLDPDFEMKLKQTFLLVEKDIVAVREQINTTQRKLLKLTDSNIKKIQEVFHSLN